MTTLQRWRRVSFLFLAVSPIIVMAAVATRPLRIPGVHHTIGAALCILMIAAAWALGAREISNEAQDKRLTALSGTLLKTPFALMALFWVGLGPPWVATAAENQMRYLVLIGATIAIFSGFVVLWQALPTARERSWATLGFSAIILAGPVYLIWAALMFGASFAKAHTGDMPEAFKSLDVVVDLLLFLGGGLTYLATAAFAASMGRAGWLGRGAVRAYLILNLAAFLFLLIRGVQFPDPAARSSPWYTSPGFVVGIPAVPFLMPYLLGVTLLRRAGDAAR